MASQADRFKATGNFILGKAPKGIDNLQIATRGSGNRIIFHDNVDVRNLRVSFWGNGGTIEIGSHTVVRIRADVSEGGLIRVGKDCAFNKTVLLTAHEGCSIIIGDSCLFADTQIRTSDMHAIYDEKTGVRLNSAKSVIIGNRVWMADRTLVLKGSKIGDDSIIAAGAIIAGADIQSNSIAAGVPAKVIKTGVIWTRKLHDHFPG